MRGGRTAAEGGARISMKAVESVFGGGAELAYVEGGAQAIVEK